MAAISDADKKAAAKLLGLRIFTLPNNVARFGMAELEAIIQAIDDAFEALPATFNPVNSIAMNIHDDLQALDLGAGVAALSVAEEAVALTSWAEIKHGDSL